jgi:outer membrane protein TolC
LRRSDSILYEMTEPTSMVTVQSNRKALALCMAILALAGGCAVGPDYKTPAISTPAAFKEDPEWKVAAPADDSPRGPWWAVYNDPVLNDLEAQVEASNFTIAEAAANYE